MADRLSPFAFSHPPAWVDAIAVIKDVGRPIAGFRGWTASEIVCRFLRLRPGSVAVEEDVVAAVVMPPVAVPLQRLQHVVLVERLRPDPIAAGVPRRLPFLHGDSGRGVADLGIGRRVPRAGGYEIAILDVPVEAVGQIVSGPVELIRVAGADAD